MRRIVAIVSAIISAGLVAYGIHLILMLWWP